MFTKGFLNFQEVSALTLDLEREVWIEVKYRVIAFHRWSNSGRFENGIMAPEVEYACCNCSGRGPGLWGPPWNPMRPFDREACGKALELEALGYQFFHKEVHQGALHFFRHSHYSYVIPS